MIYVDKEGVEAEAFQLKGPTILNTVNGECVAEEGQWVVSLPAGGIVILDDSTFSISFSLKG